MAALACKVELRDVEDRVVVTDWAYGNTGPTVKAAAAALARSLENEHTETHPGCHGVVGRIKKAGRD